MCVVLRSGLERFCKVTVGWACRLLQLPLWCQCQPARIDAGRGTMHLLLCCWGPAYSVYAWRCTLRIGLGLPVVCLLMAAQVCLALAYMTSGPAVQ